MSSIGGRRVFKRCKGSGASANSTRDRVTLFSCHVSRLARRVGRGHGSCDARETLAVLMNGHHTLLGCLGSHSVTECHTVIGTLNLHGWGHVPTRSLATFLAQGQFFLFVFTRGMGRVSALVG